MICLDPVGRMSFILKGFEGCGVPPILFGPFLALLEWLGRTWLQCTQVRYRRLGLTSVKSISQCCPGLFPRYLIPYAVLFAASSGTLCRPGLCLVQSPVVGKTANVLSVRGLESLGGQM